MTAWDQLAEARIRAWLELPQELRETTAPAEDPALPLEVQLTQDIAQLDRLAQDAATADEAAMLRRRADELELRLMVVLESQGRPLAAQHFAQQRRAR